MDWPHVDSARGRIKNPRHCLSATENLWSSHPHRENSSLMNRHFPYFPISSWPFMATCLHSSSLDGLWRCRFCQHPISSLMSKHQKMVTQTHSSISADLSFSFEACSNIANWEQQPPVNNTHMAIHACSCKHYDLETMFFHIFATLIKGTCPKFGTSWEYRNPAWNT